MAPGQQLSGTHEHPRFVEMCALYSSGSLSRSERDELDQHLEVCGSCRARFAEYAVLIRYGIPLLAEADDVPPAAEEFGQELADTKRKLFAHLTQEADAAVHPGDPQNVGSVSWISMAAASRHMRLVPYVALIFFVAVGGYLLGARHSSRTSENPYAGYELEGQLRAQLAKAMNERDALDVQIRQRDEKLAKLSTELREKQNSVAGLKKLAEEAETAKSRDAAAFSRLGDEDAALKTDRDKIAGRLQAVQAELAGVKLEIENLQRQRVANLLQTAAMEKSIADLNEQVTARETTISDQQRLLASDRDVRELMGARDLLIADVFDVDQSGTNRRPYGRVFYTKNKSLIFYAFDLDKQRGIRNASAFQAWGARVTAKGSSHPVNMGIFYLDNEANRRWALKFDDPKVLEQIDAVFVTVEPKGGSQRPSGKQLLYAYLRSQPNHP